MRRKYFETTEFWASSFLLTYYGIFAVLLQNLNQWAWGLAFLSVSYSVSRAMYKKQKYSLIGRPVWTSESWGLIISALMILGATLWHKVNLVDALLTITVIVAGFNLSRGIIKSDPVQRVGLI